MTKAPQRKKKHKEKPNITISLKKSFGLDRLKAKINQKIKELANQHIGPVVSSDREYQHIVNALGFLTGVNYKDPSIASEQIRQAIKEIASISKKRRFLAIFANTHIAKSCKKKNSRKF